ncbi:MAG: FtsX-like permease family protein [Alphaproteobacteria bacterium]|nr:FtsX-like permease family protein [Alphaproteobacteria bacterium]
MNPLNALHPLDLKLARDMWRRRGQVLAIALVIGSAVATLVMALGALCSLYDTREAYYERNRFANVFVSLKRAPDSVAARLHDIPGVAQVDTRIARYVTIDMEGVTEPLRGLALSLAEHNETALNALVLKTGRFPNPERSNEVVVHEAFANANHLVLGSTFSAVMNGRKQRLVVTGIALSPEHIYVIGPGDLVPDDRRYGVFWMDRKVLAGIMGYQGAFNDASLRVLRGASVDDVIARVDTLLARYGATGAYGRDQQISHSFLESEFGQLTSMASVIPPIFLVVSAFLLYTVISRQIETQREEIGLLKAFGYSNADVGWHFIKFALAVAVIGLIVGWLAGAWFGYQITLLYKDYFRFPTLAFSIAPDIFVMSAGLALAVSSSGALIAVQRAVKLTPAVAMAPPQPASYRASLLERSGLLGKLTATGYMIVRHITRFPVRSSMTVIGVALSLGLLISTLQFFDSVTVMIDSFFFRAQRQDVTLRFSELRADSVRAEVVRLPGVVRSELRRVVSVKLTHGPRNRRVVIFGLEPGSQLSQQVDADGHAVTLPPSGLLITKRLAGHLNAHVGDMLDVNVLEGRRAQTRVRVARIIDEYVGLLAYMNRDALNRISGDGAVADGALLQIDPTKEDALFTRVKTMPGLFTISLQSRAYRMFRALLDQNMMTMVWFYVGFAAVIALGVSYNATRITLSERAHELATLRVLGYQKQEVARILVGEVALLALLSVPFGCAVGYGLSRLMIALFSTDLYQLPFGLAASTYGKSTIVILASVAISCAIVAWRIQNLDLVRVLKTRD